jgi:DNA-directed RNA polymerase beta' subunit
METRLSVFDWKARIEYACRRYYGKLVASIDYPLVCFGGIYDGRTMYIRLAKVLLTGGGTNNNKPVTIPIKSKTHDDVDDTLIDDPEPEAPDDTVDDDNDEIETTNYDDDEIDELSEPESEPVDVDSDIETELPEDVINDGDDLDSDGSDNEMSDNENNDETIESPQPVIVNNIDEQQLFDRFVRTILQCTIVSGIRGVRQTHITRTPETDDWFIETESENTLLDIMSVFGVNPYRCVTNDVIEVQAVLGLEAACRVLFEEIRNVLSFDGCYVNDRHPKLLVDTMAYYGSLQPVTRHGVNKYESSILKKSTFEQPLDTFVNAGIHSAHDEMQGVTENLMLGQSGSMGTTMCDLQLDLEALSRIPIQKINEPLMFF